MARTLFVLGKLCIITRKTKCIRYKFTALFMTIVYTMTHFAGLANAIKHNLYLDHPPCFIHVVEIFIFILDFRYYTTQRV